MTCPNCGAFCEDESKFCGGCGTKLKNTGAPFAEVRAPAEFTFSSAAPEQERETPSSQIYDNRIYNARIKDAQTDESHQEILQPPEENSLPPTDNTDYTEEKAEYTKYSGNQYDTSVADIENTVQTPVSGSGGPAYAYDHNDRLPRYNPQYDPPPPDLLARTVISVVLAVLFGVLILWTVSTLLMYRFSSDILNRRGVVVLSELRWFAAASACLTALVLFNIIILTRKRLRRTSLIIGVTLIPTGIILIIVNLSQIISQIISQILYLQLYLR